MQKGILNQLYMQLPYFLVSMPQLNDPYFSRRVVLVVEHDESGAFGVILNAPIPLQDQYSKAQLKVELKDMSGETIFELTDRLSWGGPVDEERLFILHNDASLGDSNSALGEGLYLTDSIDVLQNMIEDNKFQGQRRFFVGASSWGAGQLESEIRTGSWVMVPFDKRFVFENIPNHDEERWAEDFWKCVLRHGGCDPFTTLPQGSLDALN